MKAWIKKKVDAKAKRLNKAVKSKNNAKGANNKNR
jgi:hypothetical protein